jgi:uncharacterized protein (UPF0276 family)
VSTNIGIGLRVQHINELLTLKPKLAYCEILADNFLHEDSPSQQQLSKVRADYPLIAHSVGLSIGSIDPLNLDYLERIKTLLQRFEITFYSDHLCFVSNQGRYVPELLPLPLNSTTLDYLINRVHFVQETLQRPLILENPSTYFAPQNSTMSDIEFLNNLCTATGAKILLDVNNLWVNAYNHKLNSKQSIDTLQAQHIAYIHLGGHEKITISNNTLLLDTHGAAISSNVWQLYTEVIQQLGTPLTIIERDQKIPALTELLFEAQTAAKIQEAFHKQHTEILTTANFLQKNSQTPAPIALQEYQQNFFQNLWTSTPPPPLAIYKNSIISTLTATMMKLYQPLDALIGTECFTYLITEFMDSYLPQDPVLDHYGSAFTTFIKHHAISAQLPYLADYVHYLYLLHQTALQTIPTQEASAAIELDRPECFKLEVPTHIKSLASNHSLDLLHQACLQKTSAPVELTSGNFYFYFIKSSTGVMQVRLNASQQLLIELIPKLTNFMLVCESYLKNFDSKSLIENCKFLIDQKLITLKEYK